MTTIQIPVPDGDLCKGCEFLRTSYTEHAYQHYEEEITCAVFSTKINGLKKCVACKILSKSSHDKADGGAEDGN